MESIDKPIFDSRNEDHHIVEPGVAARRDDQHEVQTGELHNETLYDQNEDGAGEKINLATGKNFDNSTYTGMENLSIIDSSRHDESEEEDAAAKWLRENDPD